MSESAARTFPAVRWLIGWLGKAQLVRRRVTLSAAEGHGALRAAKDTAQRWLTLRWVELIGPLVGVVALYAVVLEGRFETYHGNVTGFILFGHIFAGRTHPPAGALLNSPGGYDGQFFYVLARDPLLFHRHTIAGLSGEVFRMQRMAYPALAFVLAAGSRAAIPWTMLLVNLLVVLAVTIGFGAYARARGWSGWWALIVGLTTGFLIATLRDLADPLAAGAALAGLLFWQRRQAGWATVFLTVAVLAREAMVLAVAAVAIEVAVSAWRGRSRPGAARQRLRALWPVVVVPAAAFAAWQVYIGIRYGGTTTPHKAFLPPFDGIAQEIRHAIADPWTRDKVWDLTYIGVMLAGIVAAANTVRRRVSASSVGALFFGLSLLVLNFGDPWSYTRLSAPMFLFLFVAALERRSSTAVLLCAAAAGLTLVAPFAPWFGAA